MLIPSSARLDASTICQLHCDLCRSTGDLKSRNIGYGFLKFDHFKGILDANPQIRSVEISNWGEVLLNPDLPRMLEYAHRLGVAIRIEEGVNLNDASPETLEALVAYKTGVIRCAVDGVTRETYSRSRIGGDLGKVLANIKRINEFKRKYGSPEPALVLQFVVSSHNTHEIERAILLAGLLEMDIFFKLNQFPQPMLSRQLETVGKYVGYKDSDDFLEKEGRHYMRHQCLQLWKDPQINWNGSLLGCARNIWGGYADNVFEDGFVESINNEKMNRARDVLMGRVEATEELFCIHCSVFQSMANSGKWIVEEEIYQ